MTATGQSLDKARAAQRKAQTRFAGVSEVNGVGITRIGAGFGLKVNLTSRPAPETQLPDQIDDVPITVEVVGPIRARTAG